MFQRLNDPIEIEEMEITINQTKLGRTPGPDCISAKFFNFKMDSGKLVKCGSNTRVME